MGKITEQELEQLQMQREVEEQKAAIKKLKKGEPDAYGDYKDEGMVKGAIKGAVRGLTHIRINKEGMGLHTAKFKRL